MPTRSTKPARWLAALSAAALILSLSACGKADGGPPSDGDTQGTGEVDFEEVARDLHDCLSDAGLPVEYGQLGGRSVLVQFDDDVPAAWMDKGGMPGRTTALPGAEAQAIFDQAGEDGSEEAGVGSAGPFLQVDGVDHTETWVRCLDSSGYDYLAVWESIADSDMFTAMDQLVVDASNQWAKCARENGHPDVIDARMPQSETEIPTALLPASITEDQLRQLLAVCPNFDPVIEEANELLEAQMVASDSILPDGYRAQPKVGFDFPGFDGDYNLDRASLSPEEAATSDRLSQLSWWLEEA
jgi:hypothetical protein